MLAPSHPQRHGITGALTVALALGVAGCAGAGSRATAPPMSSANSLTGDEVRQASAENLHDALMELRPQWLRPRPRSSLRYRSAAEPVVYLYGLRYGSPNTLFDMPVSAVRRVEFISPIDATTLYGTDHSGGVILVDLARL